MLVLKLSFLLAIDSFTASIAIRLAAPEPTITARLPFLFALCDSLAIAAGASARNSPLERSLLAYGSAYVLMATVLTWRILSVGATGAPKGSNLLLAMPVLFGFDNFIAACTMPVANTFTLAVLCAIMSGILAYAGVLLGEVGSRYIVARSKRLATVFALVLIILVTR